MTLSPARIAIPVLLAFTVAAAAPLPAAAAAQTCRGLSGKTLTRGAPATVKIVERAVRNADGFRDRAYLGCRLPDGKVFDIGNGGGDDDWRFGVVKTAGRFALIRQYNGCPGCLQTDARKVVDLATGRSRTLWRFELAEGDCPEHVDENPGYPKRLVLGANGIAAGVFVGTTDCSLPKGKTLVLASVPGRRAALELDRAPVKDIPSTSLRLSGRTVSWTKTGQKQSRTMRPA